MVSGDLDEFAIAALAADPVDAYGAGTSVVTGSGAPTAGLVYKLVEVDGRPVAKRSEHKATQGGRKRAYRVGQAERHRDRGGRRRAPAGEWDAPEGARPLQRPLIRGGEPVPDLPDLRGVARAPARGAGHPALGRAQTLAGRAGDPNQARVMIAR